MMHDPFEQSLRDMLKTPETDTHNNDSVDKVLKKAK